MPANPTVKATLFAETKVGGNLTVRVAGFVVAVPLEFVNTARYILPLSLAALRVVVKDKLTAPLISSQFVPSVLTCHRIDGVGTPTALAVNIACSPEMTEDSAGCVVTTGANLEDRVFSTFQETNSSSLLLLARTHPFTESNPVGSKARAEIV